MGPKNFDACILLSTTSLLLVINKTREDSSIDTSPESDTKHFSAFVDLIFFQNMWIAILQIIKTTKASSIFLIFCIDLKRFINKNKNSRIKTTDYKIFSLVRFIIQGWMNCDNGNFFGS